jgi:K+ transporter
MIYVVMVPSPVWVLLLWIPWAALAYRAFSRSSLRHRTVTVLLIALALRAAAGSAAAIATDIRAISPLACGLGYLGLLFTAIVMAVEAVLLAYLFRVWQRHDHEALQGFASLAWIWFVFSVLAGLAHMRSSALCTV